MSTQTEDKFRLGASHTIGSYILPGEIIDTIYQKVNRKIKLTVTPCNEIVKALKEKKLDLGFIESPIFDDSLIYREWFDDELVIVSNTQLPKFIRTEELYDFKWVCREDGSHTKKLISEVFEELGVSCDSFNVLSEVSNTTASLQSVKRAKIDKNQPTVTVLSKHAVIDEVHKGELYESRMYGFTMTRKFYIIYSKENKNNAFVDNVVNYILSGNC
jgi:DNA-binding transcriptional LysR family regulator